MATVLVGAALALALVLLVALHRNLDALPARVWGIARQERARDEQRALTTLQEATAAKVGAITAALRTYEDQVAERARAQVTAATTRARVAEREAAEAASVLAAASALVRDQRALLDALGDLPALAAALRVEAPGRAPGAGAAPPASEPDPDARCTVELPRRTPEGTATNGTNAKDGEEADSEELTTVSTRPVVEVVS